MVYCVCYLGYFLSTILMSTIVPFAILVLQLSVLLAHKSYVLNSKNGLKSLLRVGFSLPSTCDFIYRPHGSSRTKFSIELHGCQIPKDLILELENSSDLVILHSTGQTFNRFKRSQVESDYDNMAWPYNIVDPNFNSQWHIVSYLTVFV